MEQRFIVSMDRFVGTFFVCVFFFQRNLPRENNQSNIPMNVITLANVENGANNFKFRIQFNKINGTSRIIMWYSTGMLYHWSINSLIFLATKTMYTQHIPSWYTIKKPSTIKLREDRISKQNYSHVKWTNRQMKCGVDHQIRKKKQLMKIYIANGDNQRNIGGPSSRANFIETGYVRIGTRFRLQRIYWDRTCVEQNGEREKKNARNYQIVHSVWWKCNEINTY